MTKSVWTDSTDIRKYKKLEGNIKTDVLIIGGGMSGILCAYLLKKAGISYLLAEANNISCGITKNTTAKITSQHGLIYDKLIKSVGEEKAKMYLEANEVALLKYRSLSKNINCDFEEKDAYTYSLSNKEKIENEVKAVNRLGYKAEFLNELSLPFKTEGAIKFKNQAQFNPMKFICEIAKDLNIHEHTFIREISGHDAITENGKITANKIIVATHFPFINKHGNYFLKMYQFRSYVIALENSPDIGGMYVDEAQKGMSFRNYKNLLFIGGGGHRTGMQGGNWQELRNFKDKYYPKANEKYFWATQDCMTLDIMPYIGMYSKNTPDLYVATGFNKWGMTSSLVSAMILCDMICDKKNAFAPVFSPDRSILKPQLLVNGFEAVKNILTPSAKRCPHLGCALKWNKAEHTWDCPCHGSRFKKNGTLIDNPSTGGARVE